MGLTALVGVHVGWIGVDVGEGKAVGVWVAEAVAVAVAVGDAVGEGVALDVGEGVGVGVGLAVASGGTAIRKGPVLTGAVHSPFRPWVRSEKYQDPGPSGGLAAPCEPPESSGAVSGLSPWSWLHRME